MSIPLSAFKARKYRTVSEISGPLLIVKNVNDAAYNELVKVETGSGEVRSGVVLESADGYA
ncbi:MAG: hypothetical protein QW102_04360, partial [Candidatus Nezhaarchaeales archaeon]